jgi:hypothetical protein
MNYTKGQKGQSTIEFILTFIFVLGLSFLFVNLAVNLGAGYVAHYINYAGARIFLVSDTAMPGSKPYEDARGLATSYMSGLLSQVGLQSAKIKFNFPQPIGDALPVFVGSTLEFQKPMSVFKVIGGGAQSTMLSESFLGKEPTRHECLESICQAMKISNCSLDQDITLFDNGC